MFHHQHPYPPFFPPKATKLIVGTLPPPRFSTKEYKKGDVDFCYGSINGLLWPVLDAIFGLQLHFETTAEAIQQRQNFLSSRGIGVCDIVASCQRAKIDASDLGMQDIELRDVVQYLSQYPQIETLLFTGGNSKNGPEYLFRRLLKRYELKLELVNDTIPRIHRVDLHQHRADLSPRYITTVSLTASSGAANRSIGSQASYKKRKQENPKYTTFDYRVEQYRAFF